MVSYQQMKLKKERQDEIRRLARQVEDLEKSFRLLVALVQANAGSEPWAQEVLHERRD